MKSLIAKLALCAVPILLYRFGVPLYLDFIAWGFIGVLIIALFIRGRGAAEEQEAPIVKTERPRRAGYTTNYVRETPRAPMEKYHASEVTTEPLLRTHCSECGQLLPAKNGAAAGSESRRVGAAR